MNLEAAGFAIGPPKTDHFSFTGWVIYRRETWEWCYSGILNCTLFDTTPLITIYSVDKREVRVLVNSRSIVIQACFILVFVKHWFSWWFTEKKKKLTASRSASSKRCINICHELLLRASGPTSRDCPSPQRCATVPREADHDGRGGRLLQRRAYASRVIRPTLPPELAPARLARLISGFVLSQLLLDICRYP